MQGLASAIEHNVSAALVFVAAPGDRDGTARYQVPLMVQWTRFNRAEAPHANAVAALRRGAREGTLVDASGEVEFATDRKSTRLNSSHT